MVKDVPSISNKFSNRIIWIDWMKVIGMYCIIAGHLFPPGYKYIYIFNVPLFFLISGYLCKQETSNYVFWKKLLLNYITPLFCIRTTMFLWEKYIYTDPDKFMSIFDYWIFMLKGYQNCNGACWFIYTLIIVRILFQYFQSTLMQIFLFTTLTCAAVFLNVNDVHKGNAILNVTIAYQPFFIGFLLKHYKNVFDSFCPTLLSITALLFIGVLTIYLCGQFNGNVWAFNNNYGHSFILYIIGTLGGATAIFSLSKLFDSFYNIIINILSIGNIITLGFHQIFVDLLRLHLPLTLYLSYVLALTILLTFYPIILFCRSWCPLFLGIYHPSKKNDNT